MAKDRLRQFLLRVHRAVRSCLHVSQETEVGYTEESLKLRRELLYLLLSAALLSVVQWASIHQLRLAWKTR